MSISSSSDALSSLDITSDIMTAHHLSFSFSEIVDFIWAERLKEDVFTWGIEVQTG